MREKIIPIVLLSLSLFGCSKTSTAPAVVAGPQATVTLKDGGSFTGVVTASSPTDMTLKASTGEARTYPMDQVLSVQYADNIPPTDPAPMAATAPKPAPSPMAAEPKMTVTAPAPPPPANYQSAPPPPMPVRPVPAFRTIPAGTSIQVRNNEPISSQSADEGQTFSAVVSRDVLDTSGRVAIPSGADATLVVVASHDQGKMQGRSALAVDLGGVTVAGRHYRLDTTDVVMRGKEGVGTNKRTGIFTGGGAALGGIIGAIAGGGKGAAIGAASGAGAGIATQSLTRGQAVRIPSETIMSFQLEAPIRIQEVR